ncbi:MAG TPA: adenylate kinase [Synergistaceae bacterium]|nr:adenylate kinase [Synergistaceae bacterium]HPJ25157.1 adenylate kinase [Synergistaceae bacterium]HPQ36771.1 adenylate kinase [Synergistaceae bacterium]
MKLVFLGPPGAGKGTQAAVVKEKYSLEHISTGDMLRDHVKRQTALGKEAKAFMDEGKLVPDEVIINMIRSAISGDACSEGFILDGFPRTVPQAEALDVLLEEMGTPLDRVILFEVDDETVVSRLTSRRVCSTCGAIYNIHFDPPPEDGKCRVCGNATIIQRKDDSEEVIRRRLEVYHEQTAPLIEYYASKNLLSRLDGTGPKDAVLALLGRR